MKKTLFHLVSLMIIFIVLLLLVTACVHEHEWKDATCTTPKTCITCSATEGAPLGHTYNDATCTTPKTCSTCSATEGAPLGHTYNDATCTTPKTCITCSATEGAPLGHIYNDATCTTPKTCSTCSTTEGDPLGHKINTKTSKCNTCGTFEYNIEYAVRGAVKSLTTVANTALDSYEILSIYYVFDDTCACDDCKYGNYIGDPYLTVIVVLEYTFDGETYIEPYVIGVHKLYDAVADTHYQLGYNTQYCSCRYRDTELIEIYAADYSYYYDEEDLIRIEIKKVVG